MDDSSQSLELLREAARLPGAKTASFSIRQVQPARWTAAEEATVEEVICLWGADATQEFPDHVGRYPLEVVRDPESPAQETPPPPGGGRFIYIPGGAQIGPTSFYTGTLACWVEVQYGSSTFFDCALTAAHVMDDPNDPTKLFPECFQPASNSTSDIIGNYFDAVVDPLDVCVYRQDKTALANEGRHMASGIDYISHSLGEPIAPAFGMSVRKFGMKTGLTWGLVKSGGYRFIIEPDPKYMKKDDPIAVSGDSGALWVTRDSGIDRPVGVLTRGSQKGGDNYAVASAATVVASNLDITSFTVGKTPPLRSLEPR